MSQDRVVRWKKSKPSKLDIHTILVDYFSGAASVFWMKSDARFHCHLEGISSNPLRRVFKLDVPLPPRKRRKPKSGTKIPEVEKFDFAHERCIEVWFDKECLFVMTRLADEFTNGVAERLTEVFARAYQAEREPD